MIVGFEIREKEGVKIEVGVKKLQNLRNLTRARYHYQALLHEVSDEEVKNYPRHYRIHYGEDECNWNQIKRRACAKFGCVRIDEIPYEKIEEANDYAIELIDELFNSKRAE